MNAGLPGNIAFGVVRLSVFRWPTLTAIRATVLNEITSLIRKDL